MPHNSKSDFVITIDAPHENLQIEFLKPIKIKESQGIVINVHCLLELMAKEMPISQWHDLWLDNHSEAMPKTSK